MSQRFIRCPHCRLPHDGDQVFCPSTGKPIRVKADKAAAAPPEHAHAPAPPSSRRPSSGHLLGKTIGGRYRVRSLLGEGGMGTVFEAEHIALGRSVAVKVLHATQATKRDAIRRFQHEARAAGAIGHPNICGVIDLGTLDDGSPYIVMEGLVGQTLAERVALEGGLPFDDVIDILIQVLSGLVAAHQQQIVHRDIKPENIFLTTRVGCPPIVKILDFGVSKVMGLPAAEERREELALTRTGMVMGTPYYMAPEQARGERDLDARVDLYACGVILYEALTGRRPFTASNYNALLLQILSGTPRPATELRPALPEAFADVIEKAMARRREDRYSNAADFQRELQVLRERESARRLRAGAVLESAAASTGASRRSRLSPPERRPVEVPSGSVDIPITLGTTGGVQAAAEQVAEPAETRPSPLGRPGPAGPASDPDDDGDPTQLMAPAKPRH